jgi:hypothetical protein
MFDMQLTYKLTEVSEDVAGGEFPCVGELPEAVALAAMYRMEVVGSDETGFERWVVSADGKVRWV